MFRNLFKQNESSVLASYVIAHEIAKHSKPFLEGEFFKNSMLKVVDIVCPDKKPLFNEISCSKMTIIRRIEDIGEDILKQLQENSKSFNTFSIALDESTDICDTAQLLIFICGVTENFVIFEELLSMESLKDRTRGCDIFNAVEHAFDFNKIN